LQLLEVQITEKIGGKGPQMLGRLDQPVQHRIGANLEDPRGRPNAESLRQADQHPHDQVYLGLLAMKVVP
jgi:hypothetical protein